METAAYLINRLVEKAKKKGDNELIDKLKSPEFYGIVTEVAHILTKIGVDVVDRNDNNFDAEKEINLKISRALAQNYQTMYYINLKTNEYIGYSSSEDYQSLNIQERGKNFFEDSIKNAQKIVFPADYEMVKVALEKENLMHETSDGKTFSLEYRLVMNGEPVYMSLKALKMADMDDNLIIGVSNINEEKKAEIKLIQEMEENVTYSNIALALARNFSAVYFVNTKTDAYHEYKVDGKNQKLILVDKGQKFFAESKKNALKYIVPEDQKRFIENIEKDNILAEIESGEPYSLTYQQLIDESPVHVQLTAINLINDEDHIIFAVRSIDAQMRREQAMLKELEDQRSLARTDSLTGVRNKFSYTESEKTLNELIKEHNITNFSLAICDVNDLKIINDTLGHDAGDKFIRDAVSLMKKTFKHSNIYRIGGDEFVIILRDSDYFKRDYLYEQLQKENMKNMKLKQIVLACGISDFDPENDKKVSSIFVRADEKMYENKRKLKELYTF